MLLVGNSRGELWVVKEGLAKGPGGLLLEVPWVEEGVHYSSAVVRGARLFKPDGVEVGEFNLALVPYGLYSDGFKPARYAIAVGGDYAYVFETEGWRIVEKVECSGKWDFMYAYPFADVKSLYCTDGFVVVVKPETYGVFSAPCGVSYHVDVLDPHRAVVADFDYSDEGMELLLKKITLDGRFLGVERAEFKGAKAVEPLSTSPLVVYVEEWGGRRYVYWGRERVEVGERFFVSRLGVVVENKLGDKTLACTPVYVHGNYYVCGEEVLELTY